MNLQHSFWFAPADNAWRSQVGHMVSSLQLRGGPRSCPQAENASWSAKLMAHRDWHDQEMVAQQRQLKQEAEDKVGGGGWLLS